MLQTIPLTLLTLSLTEWQIIDLANVAHTRQTVSLYDTYDDASAIYVLDHSEAKVRHCRTP